MFPSLSCLDPILISTSPQACTWLVICLLGVVVLGGLLSSITLILTLTLPLSLTLSLTLTLTLTLTQP